MLQKECKRYTGAAQVEPLGAVPVPRARNGLSVSGLARYLQVSRQNLSGVLSRLARDGRVKSVADGRDGKAKLVTLTEKGRQVWLINDSGVLFCIQQTSDTRHWHP